MTVLTSSDPNFLGAALAALALALLAGVSCGGGSVVGPREGRPARIISLTPSTTEILHGVGAFDRVIAVSDYCTYPPEVKGLPRVLLAGVVGASLGVVGAALQAMFRNPLAEPLTLGVSGGGALGASVAIAFGMGARVAGLPVVFVAAFLGACASAVVVYRLARTGATVLPGALLLAGVVVNTIAAAGVVVLQYFADYSRALQILRWTIGSLDVVGFDLIWRMLIFLVPGWVLLFALARDLHLLAVDEETALPDARRRRLAHGAGRGRTARRRDYSPRGRPRFLWLLRRQQRYTAM